MLVLLFLGVHIGIALGLVGFAGMIVLTGERGAVNFIGSHPYTFTASYLLTVVPLFLLMGYLAFHSGITRDVFYAARVWLARLPGGLAMATVAGSAAFGAACASSLAAAAAMGRIALPEMKRYGYDQKLATGAVAAGGTIASMIPPSVLMVLYGIMTEQSIGRLLIAGFLPGVLSAFNFMLMIWLRVKRNPQLAPTAAGVTWWERLTSLRGIWGILVLGGLVMGGIYIGIFTPSEAGAIGAFGAFLIALATRKLTWDNLIDSLSETTRTTAMIFFIAIGAALFVGFLAVSRIPFVFAEFVAGLEMPRIIVLAGFAVIYIILGMLLDPLGLLLLTIPIIFPAAMALGYDPIWFGVIIIKFLEIGLITPPVGLNVYVVKGVAPDVPLEDIFRGIGWFFVTELVTLALLVAFPSIALWLPQRMMGG